MTPPKQPVPPADTQGDARNADIAELSYEAARDELVGIVGRLEGGQSGLGESMRLWERGEALADHCAAWLDGAERRLRREDTAGAEQPDMDGAAEDSQVVGEG